MSEELIDVENDIKPLEPDQHITQNSPLELTKKNTHTPPTNPEEFDFAFPARSVNNKTMIIDDMPKYTYPAQMTQYERENWTVSTDHCYARPWNWRPETSFLRPAKTLFVPKPVIGKRKSTNPLAPLQEVEDIVDIETEPDLPTPIYDVGKVKHMMEECDKHAASARLDESNEDWEEKISKINWTATQNRLFSGIVNILNSFNLAKLAQRGVYNEPLLRRTVIDKAVQRVRRLLATVSWDSKLTQWLHQILIDNLSCSYLSSYLDILQTLKSKLPTFIDKMMYGPNSSTRLGPLNNSSLHPLLERPWDPVASSLIQDKPKKLPGNPVIILVPTAPIISKRINKWIKLLSHLATVVTIPTNFGSAAHRMTMTNCIDQMFSMARGKIQEVRADYPGRHIVLLGFNAGGTLALQVAQVEPVLCVISLGFSLLTGEGRRGEPDDNLLELQCPVLFVIGQCSNTSLQEDVEDLRERMRVETGLIVVGSADDYLRVNKKKKKSEGITQSVVDRCIVDEVGEFVSGIILSPYPPQMRQSPTHASTDAAAKKAKIERKRYNSNTSSLDSEPPSPTPRITRPVGRPPGSKSKTRLETKWAQQIAQGTNVPSSPSSSPPPFYPNVTTPDTSSNDSSLPDKLPPPKNITNTEPPLKKIKTLKPVVTLDKHFKTTTSTPSPVKIPLTAPARMQAYGFNRSVMQSSNLSTLLQGGIKTIPPSQPKPSTIKVLENVTLNSNSTAKLISNNGRTIDLSKITVINSVKGSNTAVGNVLLLPDGKLKTVHNPAMKGSGGTPILLPLSPQRGPIKSNRGKYITAKRQLLHTKPPRPVKKPIYMQNQKTLQPTLPPPTNLTTQDIMDLPIIFADDNQILDTSLPTDLSTSSAALSTPTTPKILSSHGTGKYMLVNKQAGQGNFIITPSGMKKPSAIGHFAKQTPKYTKIILSSKRNNVEDLKTAAKIQSLSPEITVKKVPSSESVPEKSYSSSLELIDLENEIEATAVPKPNMATSDVKNITIIPKNSGDNFELPLEGAILKRPASIIDRMGEHDINIPPKLQKLSEHYVTN